MPRLHILEGPIKYHSHQDLIGVLAKIVLAIVAPAEGQRIDFGVGTTSLAHVHAFIVTSPLDNRSVLLSFADFYKNLKRDTLQSTYTAMSEIYQWVLSTLKFFLKTNTDTVAKRLYGNVERMMLTGESVRAIEGLLYPVVLPAMKTFVRLSPRSAASVPAALSTSAPAALSTSAPAAPAEPATSILPIVSSAMTQARQRTQAREFQAQAAQACRALQAEQEKQFQYTEAIKALQIEQMKQIQYSAQASSALLAPIAQTMPAPSTSSNATTAAINRRKASSKRRLSRARGALPQTSITGEQLPIMETPSHGSPTLGKRKSSDPPEAPAKKSG